MATIGANSKSFLRSSIYEVSEPFDDEDFFKKLLKKNQYGLIRNKKNILDVTRNKGIQFRMVFNAMNMRNLTKEEISEHLKDIAEELNDLGVSGIVEFHNADGTQNSDHIHLWVSSEDRIIYNRIANYLVDNALSNKEDVYIQKFQTNGKIDDEFLYKENIKHEEEENYASEEERELIDEDYKRAQKHIKTKKEKSDGDLRVRSIQGIQESESKTIGIHRDLLPTLSNWSVADSGREKQHSMLLPFDEEREFHLDGERDSVLRLQSNIDTTMGSTAKRVVSKTWDSLQKRLEALKQIVKGDRHKMNTEKEETINDDFLGEFKSIDKKTASLYKELYGIKEVDHTNNKDIPADEGYLLIQKLRKEQTQIMRQL